MTDFVEWLPLYTRTEDDIRLDFNTDANAGLSPSDSDWVDTRPGTFFHMVTQPFVQEAARLHDYISTIPAVAFLEYAYGEYLDYHAAQLNTERKAAVAAVVVLTFTGDVDTEVTAGTQVSTEQPDENTPPVFFRTLATVSIPDAMEAPTGLTADVSLTGGHLSTPQTRYYKVVAFDAAGMTTASGEASAECTGSGNAAQVTLSWDSDPLAVGWIVYYGTSADGEDHSITVDTPGLLDDGTLEWTAGASVPVANDTGGAVYSAAVAQEEGNAGNVGQDALTQMVTYNPGVASVINRLPASGGADVENDAQLQTRLLGMSQGDGPGNINDYVKWLTEYTGIDRAQVLPLWQGPGTVGLIAMDAHGNPVSQDVIDAAQSDLDPYPGLGGGTAPIDHIVTVMTPQMIAVDVTAALTFAPGYSLDGVSNTTALRSTIEAAVNSFLEGLEAGQTVIQAQLVSVFFGVEGVINVDLSAPATDTIIDIDATPPEKAALGDLTLS